MSEPRVRYEDNLYHYALQQEIASLERHIHHDIDNWEMDMSKDLLDELKDLEKKCRSVNQRMKKDIASGYILIFSAIAEFQLQPSYHI